ncbi:MAG: protein kinase [Acidobacteriota bacterium]|nr:MAG: protein kinase [Acidobacteriota bacterium]
MTPERYQRIGQLFDEALELEPDRRGAFLDGACRDDAGLRAEVEKLLANHAESEEFLSRPAMDIAAELLAQNQESSLEGQQIGHYQLLSLLGAGGMGRIYLARDLRLGRNVALKLLPPHLIEDAEHVRRFGKEARAVLALNHPNILTIHDFGDADGIHYIAAEYVEGQTLRRRLLEGRLSLSEILDVATQTANALEAAHRAGVIHRDIKPENIMIRPDGLVKVLDFGLARITEAQVINGNPETRQSTSSLTDPGRVFGTANYMSPEQARGQLVNHQTDIFSLGVMLYEMCAGRLPFTGLNSIEVMASILHHDPEPLSRAAPETPARFERLIDRALCKDLDARTPDAGVLLAELKELRRELEIGLEEEPGTHPTTPVNATARQLRALISSSFSSRLTRPTWWLWLAATLVLVLTAALYWFYRQPARLTERDTILLADSDNKTGDAAFDGAIRQALAVQLGQSPFLNLYPDTQIRETLRMMNRPPDQRITTQIGAEICQRQGLKALLTSSIAPVGGHYLIVLEVLQAHNGEVVASELAEAESKEQVLKTLGQAARRLRERLGESLSQIQQFDKPIEQATTSSLEALKAYSLGVEYTQSGNYVQGIPAYQRAVELDPNFALAWLALARESYNTGFTDQADWAATKAYELRDRATQTEKLRITNFYYVSVTGNLEEAIRSAEVWREAYPNNWQPYHALSDLYITTGQYELSVERGRTAVNLNPTVAAAYSNPAGALYGLNRFDEALAIYRQAMARGLDAPEYHGFLFRIADIRDDLTEMRKQLDWSAVRKDWAYNMRALWLLQRGQWQAAQKHSRQSLKLYEQYNAQGLASLAARYEGVAGALIGDCRIAGQRITEVLSSNGYPVEKIKVLPALALCGETARARALAAGFREQYKQDTLINGIWSPVTEAAVNLVRDKPDLVLETLPAGHPDAEAINRATESWSSWLRGQAWLQKGAGTEAAAEFRSILDHRGRTYWQIFWPLAHLGYARAVALTGETAAARQAYRNFLSVWKDADAGLPIMVEARSELEKLR